MSDAISTATPAQLAPSPEIQRELDGWNTSTENRAEPVVTSNPMADVGLVTLKESKWGIVKDAHTKKSVLQKMRKKEKKIKKRKDSQQLHLQRCMKAREQQYTDTAQKLARKQAAKEATIGIIISAAVLIPFVELVLCRAILLPLFDTSDDRAGATNPPCHNAVYDSMRLGLTNDSPWSELCDREYFRYIALVYWVVTVLSGIGTEVIVGTFILGNLSKQSGEQLWLYAQFLFSLCAVVAFQGAASHAVYSLPFLVGGLWKFGFPETVGSMSLFLKSDNRCSPKALCHFFNAIGTLCHHSSAALLICLLLTGLQPLTRPIIACIIPLIWQHIFVPTKYMNNTVYVLIELVLDIYFQMEVLTNLEYFQGPTGMPQTYANPFGDYDPLVFRCAIGMLWAHELYLTSASLGLIAGLMETKDDEQIHSHGVTGALGSLLKSVNIDPLGDTFSAPEDENELLVAQFMLFDKDKNGTLDVHEVSEALGGVFDDFTVATLISRYDFEEENEEDTKLSFDEFCVMIESAKTIQRNFSLLDVDGDGAASMKEVKRALYLTFPKDDVKALLEDKKYEIQHRENTCVTFDEYCLIMDQLLDLARSDEHGEVEEWQDAFGGNTAVNRLQGEEWQRKLKDQQV